MRQVIACPACDGLGGHDTPEGGWTVCTRCKGECEVEVTARTVRQGGVEPWPWIGEVAGD